MANQNTSFNTLGDKNGVIIIGDFNKRRLLKDMQCFLFPSSFKNTQFSTQEKRSHLQNKQIVNRTSRHSMILSKALCFNELYLRFIIVLLCNRISHFPVININIILKLEILNHNILDQFSSGFCG